jgi:ornithine decarboxylase
MKKFNIASCIAYQKGYFETQRKVIDLDEFDYTDVAVAVITTEELKYIEKISATKFGIPIFLIVSENEKISSEYLNKIYKVSDTGQFDFKIWSRQIETAAKNYVEKVIPPFFKALNNYVGSGNSEFDCPGHQGGQFYRKHPAGRTFYEFFGEKVFRADLCNADVKMGDLLIHEGKALESQKYAARVFNADKTYYVLSGTSAANKIITNALLTDDDLVLIDRNNHKSVYYGALDIANAKPVFLETARNPYGLIGGIDGTCLNETYLRKLAAEVSPKKAKAKRPFRLAIIQATTYDGTMYNVRKIVDKIGKLCDYIMFDSAWAGYEQFIPMLKDASPMLLNLTPEDPGIIVAQSVHKQQAGFSQASQIHKKDDHIKGQKRYCTHKVFNNAFRMFSSTSPFYQIFASLDINAKMHDGPVATKLWMDCVEHGIVARKSLLENCKMIKPFIPLKVNGKFWKDIPNEEIKNNLDCFKFKPGEKWHAFDNYLEDEYFVDPCKLLLTTPGIDFRTGEYESFGIPARILTEYLRENLIIPEKSDLNSILFLLTPAETKTKIQNLVTQIAMFERLVEDDVELELILPDICKKYKKRYANYTIKKLCQEMHDYYKKGDVKSLQRNLFRKECLPEYGVSAREARKRLVKGDYEYVPLRDIVGRVALEGAVPYPPGIISIAPGEKWNKTAQSYFLTLEKGINKFPGFEPEIQGVYFDKTNNGHKNVYAQVLKKRINKSTRSSK